MLKTGFTPYMSSPFDCTLIAENILNATILAEQKKYQAAIAAFSEAIKAEGNLLYTEPTIWMIPAGNSLVHYFYKYSNLKRLKKYTGRISHGTPAADGQLWVFTRHY